MRFALSLKRSADLGREWRLTQLSSIGFFSGPSSDSQIQTVCEGTEVGLVYSQGGQLQIRER